MSDVLCHVSHVACKYFIYHKHMWGVTIVSILVCCRLQTSNSGHFQGQFQIQIQDIGQRRGGHGSRAPVRWLWEVSGLPVPLPGLPGLDRGQGAARPHLHRRPGSLLSESSEGQGGEREEKKEGRMKKAWSTKWLQCTYSDRVPECHSSYVSQYLLNIDQTVIPD